MLEHLNTAPSPPARVVIIGARGFVAGAVAERLARERVAVLALDSGDIDLLQPAAAETLAAMLRPSDAVLIDLALPPVKTASLLADHLVMIRAIIAAMAKAPVAHVVSIGTDAVYADQPGPLTEASPMAPSEIHGAAFVAREIALRSEVKAPIAFLRATLIYGAADTYNGYGPNRFRRLAAAGQDIVLGGEGEERRDHVLIDDVAEIVTRVLLHRSKGALNVATGEVHSFRAVAEQAAAYAPRKVAIKGSPRTGPMAHNGYRPFDIAACRTAFPDFRYTPLAEGLRIAAQVH
jgi:UDP-glucose 4-epimerase